MRLNLGAGDATNDSLTRDGNLQRTSPSVSQEKAHPQLLFINQHHDRAKHGPSRRVIGSHVQRHIHKRKRLTSCLRLKSKAEHDPSQGRVPRKVQPEPLTLDGSIYQNKILGANNVVQSSTELPRDRHGFRFDPFNSYPIEFRESIPGAVDYCEHSTL